MYYSCKWVQIDGSKHKISSGVILDVDDDLPTVGVIRDIYICNSNRLLFHVDKFKTSFEPHYRAYTLHKDSFCSGLVDQSNLFIPTSIHIRQSCIFELSQCSFILPFALCVPV